MMAVCSHFQMPAMALLDTDGVYGAPRFHLSADKAKVKAHIGAEVTCKRFANAEWRLPNAENPNGFQSTIKNQQSTISQNFSNRKSAVNNFRLPLLVASRTGYQNLCRLITKMKLRAKKGEGAVTEQELQEHAEGLICLTGGDEGPLAAAVKQGDIEEAHRQIDQLIGIFGPRNVYVELQRHFHREEESRNRVAIDL